MTVLRRGLKGLLYVLLAAALLALIGAGAMLAANWTDDPLSEAAQQALQYTPPAEQALQDNGYLIIAGFDAPADGDPIASAMRRGREQLQREIAEWSRLSTAAQGSTKVLQWAQPTNDPQCDDVCSAAISCPPTTADCFAWYVQQRDNIDRAQHTLQVQIARFVASATAPQFSNPFPVYLGKDDLYKSDLRSSHRLLLALAAIAWMEGRPVDALLPIEQAARLRQRLESHSNGIYTSMVTLAMHYRELRWLSQALAHRHPDHPPSVDDRLQALLSTPPASLHTAMDGETRLMASLFSYTLRHEAFKAAPRWWSVLSSKLAGRLPNKTTNDSVDFSQRFQAITRLHAHEFSDAFDQLWRYVEARLNTDTFHLRNMEGDSVNAWMLTSPYGSARRVYDIDGYRRLVLLQQQAQAQRITAANMPAWLIQSPPALRNPYTLEPMQWDADTNSLAFEGKERQSQNPDGSATYRIRLDSKS